RLCLRGIRGVRRRERSARPSKSPVLTRCLRMQVSVELDIAAESRRATRRAACPGHGAIVRIAKANTNGTSEAGLLGQNQVRTFPTDDIARCGRARSSRPPRVRSG